MNTINGLKLIMPKSLFSPYQDIKIRNLYLSGKTADQIAGKFGCYKQSIFFSLKRTNTPRRKHWKRASGDRSARWNGGRRMIKGYLHLFIPGHRLARKDGYVAEHRFLMDKLITDRSQVVHHKDENKLNNKLSNLEVLRDNGVHRKIHTKHQQRNLKGKFN